MTELKDKEEKQLLIGGVCPDFDDDCKDMSIEKATWCYTGCQGHKCNPDPNSSLGTAKGYCPLLHHCN